VARRLGVEYRTIGLAEHRARLDASRDLMPFQPAMLASIATGVRHGFLGGTGPDLRDLLARPLTDPLDVAAAAAASLRPGVAA
jgi:NAD(P)H dehydrogenase (quinone)